jgi:hypothetical protein
MFHVEHFFVGVLQSRLSRAEHCYLPHPKALSILDTGSKNVKKRSPLGLFNIFCPYRSLSFRDCPR